MSRVNEYLQDCQEYEQKINEMATNGVDGDSISALNTNFFLEQIASSMAVIADKLDSINRTLGKK